MKRDSGKPLKQGHEEAPKSPPRRAIERKHKSGDEINHDSLVLYMRERLPDREHASRVEISQLLTELLEGDVRTLGQIDAWFDERWEDLKENEREYPPHDESGEDTRYTDVGVIRWLMFTERPDIYEERVARPASKTIEQIKRWQADERRTKRRHKSSKRSSRPKPKT